MESARVIRLVGGGADALRQAIESGVMSVEARRLAEQVVRENETLKRRLRACEDENRVLHALNGKYREMELATIRQAVEAQGGGQARRDFRLAIGAALFAAGVLAAMIATCAVLLK